MATNIVALGLLPVLVLLSFAHTYKGVDFEKEFFSKRQTQTLKGIMIFVVFFHHFGLMNEHTEQMMKVYMPAQFSLAVFILLLGYTTALGHSKSEKIDFKKVWINRAWRLYLPVVIFSITFNNFLGATLFFFILTDIVYTFIKTDRNRLIAILVGNMLFPLFLKLIGMSEWWYDDIFTYFIGVALFMYKKPIIDFLRGKIYWPILGLYVLLAVPFAVYTIKNWPFDLSTIVHSTVLSILILLLMFRLNIKSKIFYFVGQYTWEIFIFHQTFIGLAKMIFGRNILILSFSMLLTIITSVAVQNGVKMLRNKINAREK
jgi:membrane-bound acyltransferase YfiQ involved in biofilm formation